MSSESVPPPAAPGPQLQVIPREVHGLSRRQMSQNALRVMYRLREGGFGAYLVGGAVRDLLIGGHPKDFDVATDATPEQVKALFRNCRLIGRRFRLAHVVYGREIIEVATFRANGGDDDGDRETDGGGRLLRDNVYGTIEEDAVRRDFTANALYYAIEDFSVRDYVGGYADVQARVLRLIGEPEARYREDPVRMLRAARLAAKLGFTIDPATAAPIPRLAPLLAEAAPARLFEETLKLFLAGHAVASFEWLERLGLLPALLPETAQALAANTSGALRRMLLWPYRNAGDTGSSRAAAVAGVLPQPGAAAGAGPACGRGAAARGRPRDPAPAGADRAAAAVLAADAGDLAAAAALRAAPAQARVPPAGASALPRRVRFPRAAPGRVGQPCRGRGVLARGAAASGGGGGRGRRGRHR